MVNYTSKRMTPGVKSDMIMFYIMRNLNGKQTSFMGRKVSPEQS
jgi:hypothetical protein